MLEIKAYVGALGGLQIVGVAGFLFYIGSFASVQLGLIDGNGSVYSACNVIAAALVGMSLFVEFNLASALIQISWIIFGLIGLIRRFAARSSARLSQENNFRKAS